MRYIKKDWIKEIEHEIKVDHEKFLEYLNSGKYKYIEFNGFKRLIESSLSRLESHAEKGFFIISAFRGEKSENENNNRQNNLMSDLKNKGLGFIELWSKWEETNDITKVKEIKSESSLFVPYRDIYTWNQFYDIGISLLKKYDQEAIVYKEPGDNVMILDAYKNEIKNTGNFNPDKIGKNYSTIKYGNHAGRNFIFEGITKPNGFFGALSMNTSGYIL